MEFKFVRTETPAATGFSRQVLTGVTGTSFAFEPTGVRCSLNSSMLYKGFKISGVTGFTSDTIEGATLDPSLSWALLRPAIGGDPRTRVTLNEVALCGAGIEAIKEVRFQMGGNVLSVSRVFGAANRGCTLFSPSSPALSVPIFAVAAHPPKLYLGYTAGSAVPSGITATFGTGAAGASADAHESHALIFSDGVVGNLAFNTPRFAVERGTLAFPEVCCRWMVPVPLMPQTASALLDWVAAHNVLMPCGCCRAAQNMIFAQ